MMNEHSTKSHDVDAQRNALEHRLSNLFEDRASHVSRRGAGAQVVRQRASARRTDRRRAIVGSTAAAVLVSGSAWVMNGGLDKDTTVRVGSPTSGSFAEAAPLEWSIIDRFDLAAYPGAGATTADGTRYQLSTAPASSKSSSNETPGTPNTLYSSKDGKSWSAISKFDGYSIRGIAARGDDLYVVGTSASTKPKETSVVEGDPGSDGPRTVVRAHPGDAVVRRSTDGGATWTDIRLPVEMESMFDNSSAVGISMGVEASEHDVVAAVSTFPFYDSSVFASLGKLSGADYYMASQDGSGVDVMGIPDDIDAAAAARCPSGWTSGAKWVPASEPAVKDGSSGDGPSPTIPRGSKLISRIACQSPSGAEPLLVDPVAVVKEHHSWADAGLAPVKPSTRIFRSEDGGTFTDVTPPEIAASTYETTVHTARWSGGFAVVTSEYDRVTESSVARMWTSTDGAAWEAAAPLPQSDWIADVGVLDDKVVVLSGVQSGLTLSQYDGAAWKSTELASIVAERTGWAASDVSVGMFALDRGDGGFAVRADHVGDMVQKVESNGMRLEVRYTDHAEDEYVVTNIDDGSVVAKATVGSGSATVIGRLRIEPNRNHGTVTLMDEAGTSNLATFKLESKLRQTISHVDPVLVWSPDGTKWGAEAMSDIDPVFGTDDGAKVTSEIGIRDGQILIEIPQKSPESARRAAVATISR